MDSSTIEQMIRAGLPDAQVDVSGADGVHFEACVVSPSFQGLPTLKRHRMVYATLGALMGREIHALGLRTLTPEEHRGEARYVMARIEIIGGVPLQGEVWISGAKNAVLPILVGSLLGDGPSVIDNVPHLQDVTTTLELLGRMGARLSLDERMQIGIDPRGLEGFEAPYDLVKTMRASILVLGPLVGRYGRARVALPGGCAIGTRPVDLLIMALEKLGADIAIDGGYVIAKAPGALKGAAIDFPKVRTASIVAWLYITGTVAGILSVVFTGPILNDPDFLVKVSINENAIVMGALFVLMMGLALAMVPVMLFPIFREI